MAVDITFRFKLKPDLADAYCASLPQILEDTARRPGFEAIKVVRNKEEPTRVLMIERWESEQAYHDYIAWRTERGDIAAFTAVLDGEPTLEVWPAVVADLTARARGDRP